jgi:hypothetical protein
LATNSIKRSQAAQYFSFALTSRFALQRGGLLFGQSGDCNVESGYFMAVRTPETACISAVDGDEAGTWKPMIVKLPLAFWTG